jgi:hypothetical protein
MTRVGGSDSGVAGQGNASPFRDESLQSGRETHARSGTRDTELDGKQRIGKSAKTSEVERAAAFQNRIRAAEKEAGAGIENGPARSANEPRADTVLAVVEWKANALSSGLPQPGAATEAKASTATGQAVAALVERIEQAVRAEMFASIGRPSLVSIDLGGAVEGLRSLTVSMTETALDVTLVRAEGVATAELIGAAQALAERLQQRFGRRIVRVLDSSGDASAEAKDGGGMQAISRILGHQAT